MHKVQKGERECRQETAVYALRADRRHIKNSLYEESGQEKQELSSRGDVENLIWIAGPDQNETSLWTSKEQKHTGRVCKEVRKYKHRGQSQNNASQA